MFYKMIFSNKFNLFWTRTRFLCTCLLIFYVEKNICVKLRQNILKTFLVVFLLYFINAEIAIKKERMWQNRTNSINRRGLFFKISLITVHECQTETVDTLDMRLNHIISFIPLNLGLASLNLQLDYIKSWDKNHE